MNPMRTLLKSILLLLVLALLSSQGAFAQSGDGEKSGGEALLSQAMVAADALSPTTNAPQAIEAVTGYAGYAFSQDSGTYTALAGDTVFAINGGGGSIDDGYSATQTIPFAFNFSGTEFTTYRVNSNGWLGFGAPTTTGNYNSLGGAVNNLIAFVSVDLNNAGAVYSNVTEGTAPNRIHKIQATNFYRYNMTTMTGNAQIWLYEGSHVLEIHYGTFAANWTADTTVQVGLRGTGTGDVRSLSGTGVTTWSAPTVGTSAAATMQLAGTVTPASGQIYRWTPLPPTIGYIPFVNTSSTANRTLANVTITDVDGVNVASGTAPRLYYKRSTDANEWNDNTSGSNGWKYVEANGTSSPFDFTIDYVLLSGGTGVSVGNIVQYFVVAQDLAGTPVVGINSGTFATVPSSVALTSAAFPIGGAINSYAIATTYAGAYDVPGTFPSLTNDGGIFQAFNNGVLTGNVTINIVGDLAGESGTHALNQWAEEGAGNYTVLIKPTGAPRTITGSINGALIKFNGADNVTLDGSTSGGTDRSLTIQNTNPGTSAIVIAVQSGANGAQNNTIKNVNVWGQNPTTTRIGIALGGNTVGTGGTDNDGNRVQNCTVRRAIFGIFSSGVSAANPNTGTVITQNDLSATGDDRIRRVGIIVFNEDGIQITENSMGGINSNESADAIGIAMGIENVTTANPASGGVVNAFVSRNQINGVVQTNTYSASGIAVAGGTAGPNTIVNNMIAGVTANSTFPDFPSGIFVAGVPGSDTRLYYNSASMTGARGTTASQSPSYGLAVTDTDPVLTLRNNIFSTTQTSGGGVNAKSYAVGMATTTFGNINSNYNLFWSAGANDGGFRTGSLAGGAGTESVDLAAWQTAVADDANSLESDPLFISTTDLHLFGATSPAANAGTPVAGITTDFDGQTRDAATPDIGADEGVTVVCPLSGTYNHDVWTSDNPCVVTADTTVNGRFNASYGLLVNNGATLDMGGNTIHVAGTLTNNGRLRQSRNVTGAASFSFFDTGGYGGVTITPAGNMGATTVEIRGNQNCTTDNTSQVVQRCFDITPTTSQAATIRFYYAPGEANGNAENAVSVYHWNSASWDMETGTYTRSSGADPRWVEVTGVSSYSPFVLDDVAPTAVTLAAFTGNSPAAAGPWLAWLAVLLAGGFALYRRTVLTR